MKEKMEKLIIFGNGKISKVIYHFLKKQFKVIAFTVDSEFIKEKSIYQLPVIAFENIEKSYDPNVNNLIIAVGYIDMNNIREQKYLEAKQKGFNFINYIHPSVEIHDNFQIGENNVILDQVSIQPFSKIGNSNFIWSNAVLGHGTSIENTNWVASNATISGDTVIKSKCFIGVNSTIGHNIVIEKENFIGAHTLVTKNTKINEVYISKEGDKFRLDSKRFLLFAKV